MKNLQPKPKKPIIKGTSKELMASSERKKKAAFDQEYLGKAQIKNKVKSNTSPYPVGSERIAIANKMKKEAKMDSLKSEYQKIQERRKKK